MGGAIGNLMGAGGAVISTAASLLGNDHAERKYCRSMAKRAEEQAKQIEQAAQRNAIYMMQEAQYQNKQLADDYTGLIGNQKTSLAANGLNTQSATAQLILKNSRLNAQLDEEVLTQNLNRSIYENETAAAFEAQQQRRQAKQYRQASKNRLGFWGKIGTTVSNFFTNK